MIQDAIHDTASVTALVDAGKKLVRLSKKTNLNSLLKSADPLGRGLKAAVPTRWNSEWIMLQSILHAHTALTTMEGVADRENVCCLMDMLDGADLSGVVEVLRFFHDASTQLSASKQPTGFLIPLVLEHARRHLQPASTDRRIVAALKTSIRRRVDGEKFAGKIGDEQYLAMALHPRYRRLQQLSKPTDDDKDRIMGLLRSEAVGAYLDRARRAPVAAEAQPEPMQASTSATSAPGGFSLALDAMSDDEADDPQEMARDGQLESRARAAVERELATYLHDKGGKTVTSGSDLLTYWRDNEERLPCLAALARKVHSTPASSAKAEITFSEAGRIVEKRRTRLLSSRVDDLIRDNRDLLATGQ